MSKSAIDYPHELASELADRYATDLLAVCERVQVVGSVRRQKPVVHDLEILVIPKQTIVNDMFGTPINAESILDRDLVRLASRWGAVIMTNGQRLKKLHTAEGLMLEICVSDETRWPVEVVIKTGPAEFSQKIVTHRQKGGYLPTWATIKDGWKVFKGDGAQVKFDDEAAFLVFLGLGWVKPEDRNPNIKPKE